MYIIKGLYYPKKVLAGMKHAAHELPGNFLGKFAHSLSKGKPSKNKKLRIFLNLPFKTYSTLSK